MILLAAQGCSRIETALLTNFSLTTITRWCLGFQTLRLDGLLDKPGHGCTRPSWLKLYIVAKSRQRQHSY
ncbi:hypothetical protein PspS35_10120 [Pseudomonas sp. S35]|nr:hypothetical protein PspS35_10120 [Pseudomonas sp. S35]